MCRKNKWVFEISVHVDRLYADIVVHIDDGDDI